MKKKERKKRHKRKQKKKRKNKNNIEKRKKKCALPVVRDRAFVNENGFARFFLGRRRFFPSQHAFNGAYGLVL